MWIRFWSGLKDNPEIDLQDDQFHYYGNKIPSDEELEDEARELSPSWLLDCDRFYFGWQKFDVLPENVRIHLMNRYVNIVEHYKGLINVL